MSQPSAIAALQPELLSPEKQSWERKEYLSFPIDYWLLEYLAANSLYPLPMVSPEETQDVKTQDTGPREAKWSESCSVLSDSLQSHGPYSSWNSPGQNTGVDSLSLLQWIFPTQRSKPQGAELHIKGMISLSPNSCIFPYKKGAKFLNLSYLVFFN